MVRDPLEERCLFSRAGPSAFVQLITDSFGRATEFDLRFNAFAVSVHLLEVRHQSIKTMVFADDMEGDILFCFPMEATQMKS